MAITSKEAKVLGGGNEKYEGSRTTRTYEDNLKGLVGWLFSSPSCPGNDLAVRPDVREDLRGPVVDDLNCVFLPPRLSHLSMCLSPHLR